MCIYIVNVWRLVTCTDVVNKKHNFILIYIIFILLILRLHSIVIYISYYKICQLYCYYQWVYTYTYSFILVALIYIYTGTHPVYTHHSPHHQYTYIYSPIVAYTVIVLYTHLNLWIPLHTHYYSPLFLPLIG